MANTLPNGVVESSNIDPASLGGFAYASSVRQTYKVASEAALDALGDMETGDQAFRLDNNAYYYFNGTAWVIAQTTKAISFTPIMTGLNLGNGTWNYSRYSVSSGMTALEIAFTLGSTSAITGNLYFNYSAALQPSNYPSGTDVGTCSIHRPGSYSYIGVATHENSPNPSVRFSITRIQNSNVARDANLAPNVPNAWQAGDIFSAKWTWLST